MTEGDAEIPAPTYAKGKIPAEESGRRGGLALKAKKSPEYFKKIGSKGGNRTRKWHDHDFFVAIGKKGGAVTAARTKAGQGFSSEHYRRIGTLGGQVVKDTFKYARHAKLKAAKELKAQREAARLAAAAAKAEAPPS